MELIDLAGNWNLIRFSDGTNRPIHIPGDIYSALIVSGELPDPYWGENELLAQWPGKEDWIIERSFFISTDFMAAPNIRLCADVLDTIAEVYINKILVGTSNNMFRPFEAEVRSVLHLGENNIQVIIRSPVQTALRESQRLPYPIPASIYPISSPHRNLIRKAQCMSGWDWGPCLMTGGIYDGIRLVASDGPFIRSIQCHTSALGGFTSRNDCGPDFSLRISAEVEILEPMKVAVSFYIYGKKVIVEQNCEQGNTVISTNLVIQNPRLWWPHGHGEAALYDLVVTATAVTDMAVTDMAAQASNRPQPHVIHKSIGFRSLEVISQEDSIGRGFKFLVNGKEVFAKGANWIPADALPSRWTRERIEHLLDSAISANMNCLRVWGGGRYESDDFYELCDKKGILIWQDCMFSCALYPSNREFLSNVEAEITAQVKRLSDHPCIALWCGNNEALGAITWYEESKKNPARYIVDYDRLTEGVLGKTIRRLDPDRCFWPSSPSAGPDDFSDNWHSDERGDMHFWSVWHEGKPFSAYLDVQPRFCSEFGFQALPSISTIASFAPREEWNISAPAFEAHQKNPQGNSIILESLLRYFRMPCGFHELLYLSQVQQAMAIRTAVEFWRSTMPRCMGTLYWQLNDVWPAISWSSLNYDGSWKLLHYEARRFYAPILLALFIKDGIIHVRLVSESPNNHKAKVYIKLIDFYGRAIDIPSKEQGPIIEHVVSIEENQVYQVWEMPIVELPCKANEAFLEATLEVSEIGLCSTSILFLIEPKRCALSDPKLETSVEYNENGVVRAVIKATGAPAFFVMPYLEGIDGQFDDSGFYLAKGSTKILSFSPINEMATCLKQSQHSGRLRPAQKTPLPALRVFHLGNSF